MADYYKEYQQVRIRWQAVPGSNNSAYQFYVVSVDDNPTLSATQEPGKTGQASLQEYLTRMSQQGWEVVDTLGDKQEATVILGRQRRS